MHFLQSLILCFTSSIIFLSTHVRAASGYTPTAADTIPLDLAVRKGSLANGFTYYIARNTEWPGKVAMELTVKVGSALQDPDQVELAHVLEHLAFGETKHFRSVFGYLDSLGAQRGRDVNGATGAEETNYWIVVPSDGNKVPRRSLIVMQDFAHGIVISPQAVDRERSIVQREIARGGGGYMQRFTDLYYPEIFRNSHYDSTFNTYEARLSALLSFDIKSLCRFYEEWYRPNLQAIIVVGDIDVSTVERQVREMFEGQKNPTGYRARPMFDVPLRGDTKFTILKDTDVPNIEVQLLYRRSHKPLRTEADYKSRLEEDLYAEMMRVRFEEIQQKYDQLYLTANHYDLKGYYAGVDVLNTHVRLRTGDVQQGVQVAARELERVVLHGFDSTEFTQAKQILLTKHEYAPPTSLIGWVSYYSANFVNSSAAPSPALAKRLHENLLQQITLEEVQKKAVELIRNPNRDVIIFAPAGADLTMPDETTVLSWIDAVKHEPIGLYQRLMGTDDSDFWSRLSLNENSSAVEKRSWLRDVNVTDIRLSNGARVILKPMGKRSATHADEVKVYAFRRYRQPLLHDSVEYFSALYAAEIVASNGLAGLTKSELTKILTSKGIRGGPFRSSDAVGFSGSSNVADAELLLKLLCEYYRNPVSEEGSFVQWKKDKERTLAANRSDTQAVFWSKVDSLRKSVTKNGVFAENPLEYIDRERAYRLYKRQFVVDSEYVVIVVGHFDVPRLIQLCTQYVGALPAGTPGMYENSSRSEPFFRSCRGMNRNIALGPDTLKADVTLIFEGDHAFSVRNNLNLDAVSVLLQDVLSQRLRDVEGAVYSVYTDATYSKYPVLKYGVTVSFACHPRKVDNLVAAVFEEIRILANDGVTNSMLESTRMKGKAALLHEATSLETWLLYLATQHENDGKLSEVAEKSRLWGRLTKKDLQKSVGRYLVGACFSRFVLMPM